MDQNDTNSSKALTKAPEAGPRKKLKARASVTAFEKAVLPGFIALLQKRARQSATYEEVKNEYGPAIRAAIDAGVGMDEFVAIYSAHKEQLTGQALSLDQTYIIKAGYRQLRADWMHGKLKGRKITPAVTEAAKSITAAQANVNAPINNRFEDRPTTAPVPVAAAQSTAEARPRVLADDASATRPQVTSAAPAIQPADPKTDIAERLNARPSSFFERLKTNHH
jgi:hypothetical protein